MQKVQYILLVKKNIVRTMNAIAMDVDNYYVVALDAKDVNYCLHRVIERGFKTLKDADAFISAISDEQHGYVSQSKIATAITKYPLELRSIM